MNKFLKTFAFVLFVFLGSVFVSSVKANAAFEPIPFEYVNFKGTDYEDNEANYRSAYPYYICVNSYYNEVFTYNYYIFTDIDNLVYEGKGPYMWSYHSGYLSGSCDSCLFVQCDEYLNVEKVMIYSDPSDIRIMFCKSYVDGYCFYGSNFEVEQISCNSSRYYFPQNNIKVLPKVNSSISDGGVKGSLDYPPFPKFIKERYKNLIVLNNASEYARQTGPVFLAYNDADLIIRWGDSAVMAVDSSGNFVDCLKGSLGDSFSWIYDSSTQIGGTTNSTFVKPYVYYTSAPLYKQKDGQTRNIKGDIVVCDPLEYDSNYVHFLNTPTIEEMLAVLPDELSSCTYFIIFRQEHVKAYSNDIVFCGWNDVNANLMINCENSAISPVKNGAILTNDRKTAYFDTATKSWVVSDSVRLGPVEGNIYSVPNIFYSGSDLFLTNGNGWETDGQIVYMADMEIPNPDFPTDDSDSDVDGFLGNLFSGLTKLFKKLFVPSDQFFTAKFNLVKSEFGFYTSVVDTVEVFVDFLQKTDFNEPPKIPINLGAAKSKINYGGEAYVLDMSWYAPYKGSVDTIISAILWTVFIFNTFKALPNTINGVSSGAFSSASSGHDSGKE